MLHLLQYWGHLWCIAQLLWLVTLPKPAPVAAACIGASSFAAPAFPAGAAISRGFTPVSLPPRPPHPRQAAKAGQEPPAGAAILWHSTSGRHGSEQSAALSGSKSSEQAFAAAPQQQSMAAGRGSSPSPRIEALHPASSAAAEEPPAGFPGAYARV